MVTLTENAAKKARQLFEKSGKPGAALRVSIASSGCSGLEYKFDADVDAPRPKDHVTESQGIKIYIDAKSLLYAAGSEVDYVSSLMNSGFKVKNPQAVAECSCGQSFTV